jgi:hypothetical protein
MLRTVTESKRVEVQRACRALLADREDVRMRVQADRAGQLEFRTRG